MSVIATWGAVTVAAAVQLVTPGPTPRPSTPPPSTEPVSPIANLSGSMILLIIFALAIGGYWLSLKLHPFTKCPRCGGKGIHRGSVFSYATRACSKCGGRGIRRRAGLRVFGSKN